MTEGGYIHVTLVLLLMTSPNDRVIKIVLYLLSSSDVVDDDDEGISADTVLA